MASTGDKNDESKKSAQPATSSNPRVAQLQAAAARARNSKPVSAKQFFEEAWVELKKTTWPTRDVLTKSTTVVLAFVFAVAIWVGVIDGVLTKLMAPLTGH